MTIALGGFTLIAAFRVSGVPVAIVRALTVIVIIGVLGAAGIVVGSETTETVGDRGSAW